MGCGEVERHLEMAQPTTTKKTYLPKHGGSLNPVAFSVNLFSLYFLVK